ncbi:MULTISPECIES: hypothetical protein [Fibrobacter]|uniref:hypothetical protein n=1 Tax=Fibrobacter TaxID=832 RepID=UPI001566A018|nr:MULTISPECIES: hypothetical protein [Fibrobacter]MBR4785835.1 hypothetical protein [Fibrobacter sp.]
MSLLDDHFAQKIAAQSRAWNMTHEQGKKDRGSRQPAEPKIGICDKCHRETYVRAFRSRQTDRTDGAASFGTVIKHYCEDCAPKSRAQKDAEVPQLTSKQVKNLMKSAKKGLL